MNRLERTARAADRFQQRVAPLAFVGAVVKKYGDDRGGSLAALIAYYGFLSLFPLLLLLVTVLGIVVGGDSALAHRIEHSALSQFPVIGTQIGTNLHELHQRSALGLVVGIAGLLWGSQGASQAGQFAMAEIWNVPAVVRPNYWRRLARTGLMTAALGVFLVVSTGLAGIVTFAGGRSWPERAGGLVLSLVVNIALYLVAFRTLTPRQVETRELVPGTFFGGAGWTVLQLVGTLLVDHLLRNTSQVYGFFAVVLGLLAYISVVAQLSLYAAELNVVRARRLWPRSFVQPPLTEADRRVLSDLVRQSQRRPEQAVAAGFADVAGPPGRTPAGPPPDPPGGHPPEPAGGSVAAEATGGHAAGDSPDPSGGADEP